MISFNWTRYDLSGYFCPLCRWHLKKVHFNLITLRECLHLLLIFHFIGWKSISNRKHLELSPDVKRFTMKWEETSQNTFQLSPQKFNQVNCVKMFNWTSRRRFKKKGFIVTLQWYFFWRETRQKAAHNCIHSLFILQPFASSVNGNLIASGTLFICLRLPAFMLILLPNRLAFYGVLKCIFDSTLTISLFCLIAQMRC